MLPHLHFIAGLFMGAIGYDISLLSVPEAFLVAILAVAIDLDHYISYAIRKRDWNIIRMWDLCIEDLKQKKHQYRSSIHKWYGVLGISAGLLGIYFINHKIGYMLLAAYGSHMLLDHAHNLKLAPEDYKISRMFGHEFSYNLQIEAFFLFVLARSLLLLF